MKENSSIRHEDYESMLEVLSAYEKAGIALTLQGKPASPKELAYLCTARETECYMPDFIPDGTGKLSEIRFDRVRG